MSGRSMTDLSLACGWLSQAMAWDTDHRADVLDSGDPRPGREGLVENVDVQDGESEVAAAPRVRPLRLTRLARFVTGDPTGRAAGSLVVGSSLAWRIGSRTASGSRHPELHKPFDPGNIDAGGRIEHLAHVSPLTDQHAATFASSCSHAPPTRRDLRRLGLAEPQGSRRCPKDANTSDSSSGSSGGGTRSASAGPSSLTGGTGHNAGAIPHIQCLKQCVLLH